MPTIRNLLIRAVFGGGNHTAQDVVIRPGVSLFEKSETSGLNSKFRFIHLVAVSMNRYRVVYEK